MWERAGAARVSSRTAADPGRFLPARRAPVVPEQAGPHRGPRRAPGLRTAGCG